MDGAQSDLAGQPPRPAQPPSPESGGQASLEIQPESERKKSEEMALQLERAAREIEGLRSEIEQLRQGLARAEPAVKGGARESEFDSEELREQVTRLEGELEQQAAFTELKIAALENRVQQVKETISFQLGAAILAVLKTPAKVFTLPVTLWKIHLDAKSRRHGKEFRESRGREYRTILKLVQESGVAATQGHPIWIKLSPDAQAAALTSMARELYSAAPSRAIDAAREAQKLAPSVNRAKWLAFRLFEQGALAEPAAFLADSGNRSNYSASEHRRAEEIGAFARLKVALPRIPEGRAAAYTPFEDSILYVAASALPYHTSGYTTRTHELLRALGQSGVRVTALTRPGYPWDRGDRQAQPLSVSTNFEGIVYVHRRSPSLNLPLDLYFEEAARTIAHVAREARAAAIQAASNHINALPALIAARNLGIPFSYEMRGLWDLTRASKLKGYERTERFELGMALEAHVARHADRVQVISHALGRFIQDWGIEKEKIHLLPNCINLETVEHARAGAKAKPEVFTVGYAGSLLAYEGLDLLIEALAALKAEGTIIRARIIGDGPSRTELETLAKKHGLSGQIDFYGKLPPQNARALLAETHAAVLPRRPDRVCELIPPIKLTEVLALGLPVIVSDLEALKEEAKISPYSKAFTANDAKQLQVCLKELFLRRHEIQDSFDQIKLHRTWSHYVNTVADIIPGRRPSSGPKKAKKIAVLSMLDPRSEKCFSDDLDLQPLHPADWENQIETFTGGFLLAEPLWNSNPGSWAEGLTDIAGGCGRNLTAALELCRGRKIPTVFWDRQEGPQLERFMPAIRHFDYIFTADAGRAEAGVSGVGHQRVRVLPRAVRDTVHNPVQKKNRLPRVVALEDGRNPVPWLESFLEEAKSREILDIHRPPAVQETSEVEENANPSEAAGQEDEVLEKVYKTYAAVLETNDAGVSAFGALDRNCELVACGTPVITVRSEGISDDFREIVTLVKDAAEAREAVDRAIRGGLDVLRPAVLGVRLVHGKHLYRHRFDAMLREIGLAAETNLDPKVTAICVSKRPDMLENVARSLKSQTYKNLRIIYVAHGFDADEAVIRAAFGAEFALSILRLADRAAFLADGLNLALDQCDTDLVAKIDDDDYYGPNYLADMVRAQKFSKAGLVGKATYFAYLEESDRTFLRFPHNHYRYATKVQGGTFLWDRIRTGRLRFERVRQGTDTTFVQAVVRSSIPVFSSDPFNYIHVRRRDKNEHTWKISDEEFTEKCVPIKPHDAETIFC